MIWIEYDYKQFNFQKQFWHIFFNQINIFSIWCIVYVIGAVRILLHFEVVDAHAKVTKHRIAESLQIAHDLVFHFVEFLFL